MSPIWASYAGPARRCAAQSLACLRQATGAGPAHAPAPLHRSNCFSLRCVDALTALRLRRLWLLRLRRRLRLAGEALYQLHLRLNALGAVAHEAARIRVGD